MIHDKRIWSIANADSPEELAEKLADSTWCGCNGFRLGGYLFLNDAFSSDGARNTESY